ncbi:MAG: TetR/AcrR family transcriptional regulator [Hyphomonas sp.]
MPRPAGVRNHDFDQKRANLLDALTDFALTVATQRPSLRQFPIAAGQSEPTLRHYFTDRQGLVIEVLENIRQRAIPIWAVAATPASDPVASVQEFMDFSQVGMKDRGYTQAHTFGFMEGLGDPVVGRAYLEKILDPALESISDKFRDTPGGPAGPGELRAAALLVMGPLFLLVAHQEMLGGDENAPLDMPKTQNYLKEWLSRSFVSTAKLDSV